MARPLKKRRHVFGLEKLINTSSSKRARGDGSSCNSSQSPQEEPPTKKQKAVLWSATVPDNKVGKRVVNRRDTPKKPKPASPSSSSQANENVPSRVHLQIDGNRAIAIKSSRLAVDMAKCRASQADLSLERAKRRESQVKAALLEAASERYLAEQEKDAAAHGVKKAADYLLNLLQGNEDDGANGSVALACIGTADKGLSLLGVDASSGKDVSISNTRKVMPEAPLTDSQPSLSHAAREQGSEERSQANQTPSITAFSGDACIEADSNGKSRPLPLKKEAPQSKSPPIATSDELILEVVKDKRVICPTTKKVGSYTGQGRTNKETGQFERHGEGYMTMPGSDFVYRGEFVANLRHGHGCELNAKGHGYSGEWRNDKKHGHGSICDVACISGGRFENDQRVGPHAYHFADGRACLKNHVNNRDLCGPCLAFSACRRYVRVCNDGDVEVVKQGMLSFYLDRMKYHADDGTILRATVPSPRKL